jgi:hypothetical protein
MSNHPITPLASSQVNHDQVKIELVEPEAMPAMVRILWPPAPTMIDPKEVSRCRGRGGAAVRPGAHCAGRP